VTRPARQIATLQAAWPAHSSASRTPRAPSTDLQALRYLFWDARHSAPGQARELGNELADRLREGSFSVDRVLVENLRPVPAVCAIGRPQDG
jgi:hypothetical protein